MIHYGTRESFEFIVRSLALGFKLSHSSVSWIEMRSSQRRSPPPIPRIPSSEYEGGGCVQQFLSITSIFSISVGLQSATPSPLIVFTKIPESNTITKPARKHKEILTSGSIRSENGRAMPPVQKSVSRKTGTNEL